MWSAVQIYDGKSVRTKNLTCWRAVYSQHILFITLSFIHRFLETIACNVISEMFYKNKSKSHELLITTVKGYGCTIQTIMKFASNNELMQFMGTTACQTKLNDIWRGDMSHFTSPKQVSVIFFQLG